MDTPTHLRITHINATEKHIFSEYDTPLSESETGLILDDDGNVIMAELYRNGVGEYGRCTGKVYIDHRIRTNDHGGERWEVKHVGYVFVSRERYEDTNEPYLRETWVALVHKSDHYVGV